MIHETELQPDTTKLFQILRFDMSWAQGENISNILIKKHSNKMTPSNIFLYIQMYKTIHTHINTQDMNLEAKISTECHILFTELEEGRRFMEGGKEGTEQHLQ